MNKVKKKSLGFVILCIALMLLGTVLGSMYSKRTTRVKKHISPNAFHGTLLNEPRAVAPFSLMDTNNTPFTDNSLKKHWTMMFFGFTRCGFVCPTTMAELAKMYRTLEAKHVSPLPHVLMVSIDPERDDLAQLRRYVTAFHPDFEGARGNQAMTRAMTHALGIAYAKIAKNPDAPGTKEDDIEHTGAVVLFNPEGKLEAFFTTPHQAQHLADDYQLLLETA